MRSLKEIQQHVDTLFAQEQFTAEPQGLYEPIDYTLRLGGKRLRPTLLLAAYEMYGGLQSEADDAAIGIEIFHNFTLLHDDLMDRSPLRRGQPTVYKRWNENTAILSGDTMYALAWRYFLRRPSPRLQQILQCFYQTGIEVFEGQQYDMDFEQRTDVSIEQYTMMIAKKTAALLAGALKIGALYANASEREIALLYGFGMNLGLAFQLEDDLLDAYGDTSVLGKPTGQDIRDCKKTYLTLRTIELADAPTRAHILDLYTSPSINAEYRVSEMMHLFDTLDIKNETLQAIDQHYHQAEQHLQFINQTAENKAPLAEVLAQLKGRKK